MKTDKVEANAIIVISALRNIIDQFLGPFLTAYFIQTSKDSLSNLSIYNIFSYIILLVFSVIISSFIERKFRIGMFRLGVILNFGYILAIVLLNEKIVNYLWLIAILNGISSTAYWMPYNLFTVTKISNSDRTRFNITLKIVSQLIGIVCPIVLGTIITATNYVLSSIIILAVSFIQIILTFLLKPDVYNKDDDFNPIKAYKKFRANKQTLRSFNSQFLLGMTINSSALEVLLVALVYNQFKSNLTLGIITSASTFLSIIAIKLYGKIYKNKSDKKLILVISTLPMLLVLVMAIYKNYISLVICYILYSVLIQLISLTQNVRAENIANSYIVKKTEQCEYNEIREIYLDSGRIMSFVILLLVAKGGSNFVLNSLMVVLSVLICSLGINITRIKKFEVDELVEDKKDIIE